MSGGLQIRMREPVRMTSIEREIVERYAQRLAAAADVPVESIDLDELWRLVYTSPRNDGEPGG